MTSWDTVNWAQTDDEIAAQRGVSRQRVHQVRAKLGKPTFSPADRRKEQLLALPDVGQRTLKELAAILGCPSSTVRDALVALGLEWKRGTAGPPVQYDWGSVNWNQTNLAIAEQLGAPISTVANKRSRLRKAGVDVPPAPYRIRADWESVDWSQGVDEIAEALGVLPSTVATRRQQFLQREGKL